MHYFLEILLLVVPLGGGGLVNSLQIHTESLDGGGGDSMDGCGIIPKVKTGHRSREAGLSSFGQIPWQAAIMYLPENLLLCSGTLISPKWVLTSSVCLLGVKDFSELEIRIGDWDISDEDNAVETYEHLVTSIVNSVFFPDPHIEHGHDTQPKFVLLQLKNIVHFANYPQIAPLCTPTTETTINGSTSGHCYLSGWGSYKPHSSSKESGTKINGDQPSKISLGEEEDDGFDTYDNPSPPEDYNSLENMKHLKLSRNSSAMIQRVPSKHLVPDPVEDYIDEIHAEKLAEGISSHLQETEPTVGESQIDSEFKTPFLDSLYPIEEHHESSLYKHKLKYKQGKMKGARNITKFKKSSKREEMFKPSSNKRFSRFKRYSGRHRRNRKVLYSSHAEPEKATILKLFKVELHDNCPPIDFSYDLVHVKQCASPSHYGHYDMFPCMADMGSPIFCSYPEKGHHHGSFYATTKSFLVGFVPAKSGSCYETFHQTQQPNSIGISLLSETDLMFIHNAVNE